MYSLTIKQIAEITKRHEETIRRKIRKSNIGANYSSRKEGYEISVDTLIEHNILTKEQVEAYISMQNRTDSTFMVNITEPAYKVCGEYNSWISIVDSQLSAQEKLYHLMINVDELNNEKFNTVDRLLTLQKQVQELENIINKIDTNIDMVKLSINNIRQQLNQEGENI